MYDHASYVAQYLVRIPGARAQLQDFLRRVAWRLVAVFDGDLLKTYGPRLATPEERAAFNLMAHVDPDLMPPSRLKEKASKIIGETAEWLDASDDNRVTVNSIWKARLLRELDGLQGLDSSLLRIEGDEPTAIEAHNLPNACAIFDLINDYSRRATGRVGRIDFIELTSRGQLCLSALARDFSNWHLGIKDLAAWALDIDREGRSPREGFRAPFRSERGQTDLTHYIGSPPYDPRIDVELVECSCGPLVREIVLKAPLTTALGKALDQ